jgi:HEAT repeat protein
VRAFLAIVVLAALLTAGLVWYYHPDRVASRPWAGDAAEAEPADDEWLEHLYSPNPRDSAEAVRHVEMLGPAAVPIIRATLGDPASDREHRRAALKACTILGEEAAAAIPEVARELVRTDMTAEAALALSMMGAGAFPPLREALDSADPTVRREALRSIGKLRERAPLESSQVVPLLVRGMRDPDEAVRSVGATYLGILRDEPEVAIPALLAGLKDPQAEVRRASAEALGSFDKHASRVLPALRRAARDRDREVAREAGIAIVKLEGERK